MLPARDTRTSQGLVRSTELSRVRRGLIFAALGLAACPGAVIGQPAAAEQPGPSTPPPASAPQNPPPPAPGPIDRAEDTPREVVVALRDGREVSGQIVRQDARQLVLRINGIETPFSTDLVEDVRLMPPAIEQYRSLRAAIDDRDVQQLLTLIKWLQQRRLYEQALQEIAHVLELEPANPDALSQRRLIESQIMLDVKAGTGRPAVETPRPARPIEPVFPLLNDEQINLIKVFELDLSDPPRMIVSRDTVRQLLERYAGNPLIPPTREGREAILREKPDRILDLMFRVRARDLYAQVKVLDHPTPMRRFRDDVHRAWLLNGCATTTCHGGQEAGRLWLFNRRPSSDATVYTNFLILDRFRLPDGKPLIDYNDPVNSPLLQMALPREDSLYPHPRVQTMGRGRDWRQIFSSTDDHKFLEAVAWINAMYRPRPDYPVTYKPPVPGQRGAEAPAAPAAPAER